MPFRTRRSIKPASMEASQPIAKEVLLEILEDAHWAPSHGLTQPWKFHVFLGSARERLAEALVALYDRTVPEQERRADKRSKLRANVMLAPVCIAIAFRLEPGGRIPEIEEVAATACAVQNLMLSAHQRGIGSFWSTPPVACSHEFVEWHGLDESHRAFGLVYLGYPRSGPLPAPARHPLMEHVRILEA